MTDVIPDWSPSVHQNCKILIVGASGGLGTALVNMLLQGPECSIGAHGASKAFEHDDVRIMPLQKSFTSENDCVDLVDEFVEKVGGIDALVCLNGAIHFSGHWMNMPASMWERDIDLNLNYVFYLIIVKYL